LPVSEDRLVGWVINGKPGSARMADDPDHSNGVMEKSFIRITDYPDDLPFEVGYAAHIINNRKIRNIIKQAIDRDVPAESILRRRSKTFLSDHLTLFIFDLFKFRVTPESGDLNHLSPFKEDMDQPEPSADDPAVFKKGMDLMGVSIRGDIKILRDLSEEKIPDASPNQAGKKTMPVEAVENLEGLFVNHGP
jgi:hypothetical protein